MVKGIYVGCISVRGAVKSSGKDVSFTTGRGVRKTTTDEQPKL